MPMRRGRRVLVRIRRPALKDWRQDQTYGPRTKDLVHSLGQSKRHIERAWAQANALGAAVRREGVVPSGLPGELLSALQTAIRIIEELEGF